MEKIMLALIAIILGIYLYIYKHFIYSSRKSGDYDSCEGTLENQCKICDRLEHRTL